MADKISDACSQDIQAFSQLIMDAAENLCPKILQKNGVREKLVTSVSDVLLPQKNTELESSLERAIKEILNKLNDIKLSITATVADKLTGEVLEDLTIAQGKLEERFPRQALGLPSIYVETEEDMQKNKNLLDITKKDISAEECKIAIRRRNKTLRSIRPTSTLNRPYELYTDALGEDKDSVASQMLLPFSCSPQKPLPFSIKDAEGRSSLFPSTLPACTEHLMDLPTEGEKLQHYTRQRPRPNRTNRQPPRKPHVLISETENTEIAESELCSKVDEGVDEFFSKKLIQEYHHIPVQVSPEITSFSSSGSRTFKKKIGEFFALRKPRSTKGLKSEKDLDGSPVATKSRKQTLTDILRPLGKSGDTARGQDISKDVTSPESRSVADPTWTPDAARRVKPRYSREGKSQSLILLSGDEEESLAMKQKRHCEKADGDICNTFEHRVHSMLHRIGVTRVLSSEAKKKQNKDGEIKKAGSEGDIVDSSAESPPPALKVRTHSMSTERATPKPAEAFRNPAEEKQIWKDLGKQLNVELKGRYMELHSSPRRSLVILEQIEATVEKKSEDSLSLQGIERCSPASSPSRIIHLDDTSEAKDAASEVSGNDENLLKPRLRLKQFQNRRAFSAHEEQLREQGFTSELDNVKAPLVRLQRSPVMRLKQRIENVNIQTNSEIKSDLETPESELSDHRKRPALSESPLAMKCEKNITQTALETAQSTAIHQRTEITSSHSSTDND
ncbi:Hypothetical predicted protein [Pelobates cultripes]|uniref:CARMIL C-terminal domain-containing protein n=1 Tax=Pelobates cultripes TaxID=61616 RepID=A0AAD1TDU7_PELCU|nr:Hypothetical predicted protein [Pelobates cultripes]